MSSLTATDKKYLEALLDMGGGYVLDFSDPTFSEFFSGFKIDIHSTKYQTYGQSKAKKLRAFWEQEEDKLVGRVLSDMIDAHRVDCELNDKPIKQSVMDQCTAIVGRLTGSAPTPDVDTEGAFLEQEFGKVSFDRMPIEDGIKPILEARLREASKAMRPAHGYQSSSCAEVFLKGHCSVWRLETRRSSINAPAHQRTKTKRSFRFWIGS